MRPIIAARDVAEDEGGNRRQIAATVFDSVAPQLYLSFAAAAYGLSFVFARNGGDYRPLFLIGSAAMIAAPPELASTAMPRAFGADTLVKKLAVSISASMLSTS